jgi:adenylate kinase family enzyme
LNYRRIVVVGTTGSGKTTLAGNLAQRLGYPHIEMDALHWEPNWTEAPLDRFRTRVSEALAGEVWITDGNYSKVRDIVWGRAEMLVWLDYPLRVNMWRLFRRAIRRSVTQEELWSGNRETFRKQFLSRDSLFIWALKTYRRRKRDYTTLPARPEYSHLEVVRLRAPRETRMWLSELSTKESG